MGAIRRVRGLAASPLSLVLWAVTAHAQESSDPPAQADPSTPASQASDLEHLIADLRSAHRGAAAAGVDIDAFEAKLEITPSTDTDDQITLVIDVRFRADRNQIRYKLDEGGRRVERGRDHVGMWTRLAENDEAVSLGKAEYEGDRAELKKHIALSRQILRFLDPAELASRFGKANIGTAELRVSRNETVQCTTVSGVVDQFPVYIKGGEPQRVELRLWIDASTHRLLAVRSFPFGEDDKPEEIGEFISMPQHQEQDGVLLPITLLFDEVARDGRRARAAKVRLLQIELNPKLGPDEFDRRQRW
jgi:hypothetical protein